MPLSAPPFPPNPRDQQICPPPSKCPNVLSSSRMHYDREKLNQNFLLSLHHTIRQNTVQKS